MTYEHTPAEGRHRLYASKSAGTQSDLGAR